MTAPPAPPSRRPTRQLNIKIRQDYDRALRDYAARYDAPLHLVVTQAIGEYLDRRGELPRD